MKHWGGKKVHPELIRETLPSDNVSWALVQINACINENYLLYKILNMIAFQLWGPKYLL